MKRYDFYKWKTLHEADQKKHGGFFHKCKKGKWVLWEDVKKLLQKLGYIEKVKPE